MNVNIDKYLVPSSIVTAGLLVGGSIFLSNQNFNLGGLAPTPSGANQGSGASPFSEVSGDIPTAGQPVLGQTLAPVTMIEFSDFQCPYCQRFSLETFPELKTKYVDTGKMKVVFINFPLQGHTYAEPAAEAAECAFNQNKFWEYQDKLFENQSQIDQTSLKKYAREIGLDGEKFDSCLDSQQFQNAVKDDVAIGRKIGIQGTPAFVINGTLIPGAYPASEFEKVIDGELSK